MKNARNHKGMSLLIVLAFIVIISVLVVGFSESMRLLRPAADSHLERARADQFAWAGVERVIATLNQQTADTERNWATQPGQLIVGSLTNANAGVSGAVDTRKVLSNIIPLHSGVAPATNGTVFDPPNLNVVTYRDPTSHLLTEKTDASGAVLPMRTAWIYVRKNGELETNAVPTISTNEIVGRYAYWTDDESSKINYNIAWGRTGNTNAPGHPTRIELSALSNFTQSQADTLRSFITNVPANSPFKFFNTPLDARRIGDTSLAAALRDNKFDVTHFNSDPNTTFFNEPRIVLTTRPNLAGWTKATSGPYSGQWVGVNGKNWADGGQPRYLRILKDPEDTTDPGGDYGSSFDTNRLAETIATIAWGATSTNAGFLSRTDWPMVSGTGSFQSKYYGTYPAISSASGISARTSRLGQMAVNVIEYVRAKESVNQIIQPINGYFDAAQSDLSKVFILNQNGSGSNGYSGLTRGPRITEMGVWYGTNNTGAAILPQSPGANASQPIPNGAPYYIFKVEFFLPRNYGLVSYDLANTFLGIQFVSVGTTKWVPNYSPTSPPVRNSDVHRIYAGEVDGGNTTLTAGNYAVVSRAIGIGTNAPPNPVPTTTGAGTKIHISASVLSSFYQFAPGNSGLTNGIPVDTGPIGSMRSLEVDDPRVNQHPGDWIQVAVNTFGSRNSRWSAGNAAPVISPELDTDIGRISDASLYMPPPKGTTLLRADGTVDDNIKGQVISVGELGYIHTGYESSAMFDTTPIPPGIPWRSLRLQPNSAGTSVVPDWALMDLFTAPVAAPNPVSKYVYAPHDTSFGGRVNLNSKAQPFGLVRTLPLAAVLQNSTYDSTDLTQKLGVSSAQTIANNIFNQTLATGGKLYGNTNCYVSPGEIVEVSGIADGGEKSEELVRQIANLVTTRGNVVSVYTIGQAIKQTPDGKLTVTAQQRMQAMVERYLDPTTNIVNFSPVYFRNLSP